jgi:hypothetical protein
MQQVYIEVILEVDSWMLLRFLLLNFFKLVKSSCVSDICCSIFDQYQDCVAIPQSGFCISNGKCLLGDKSRPFMMFVPIRDLVLMMLYLM